MNFLKKRIVVPGNALKPDACEFERRFGQKTAAFRKQEETV